MNREDPVSPMDPSRSSPPPPSPRERSHSRRRSFARVAWAGVGVMLLGAFSAASLLRADRDPSAMEPESTRPIPVRIAPTEIGTASYGHLASGTLEPSRTLQLGFAVSGVVARIEAREGDSVREGDVLAQLDLVPTRAAVQEARARAEFLRLRWERSRALASSGAITREELDGDEAALEAAEAELARAEWNLDRSTLCAPFSGIVRSDRIELGQVVGAGSPAFELVSVDSLEITVSVAVSDLPRLDLRTLVSVCPVDLPEVNAWGRIAHAPVSADPRTSAVPLRVRVDNRERTLLAGTVAEVRWETSAQRAYPVVPLSSLRVGQEGTTLFVVEGETARVRAIATGTVRGKSVEVVSGIEPGEAIVIEPPDRLRDGDPVTVVREG